MTEIPSPAEPRYRDLAGRVAVVSGGSRGIGAATARALAASGTAVAVVGRDQEALAAVAESIQERGGRALPVRADCSSPPTPPRGSPGSRSTSPAARS